MGVSYIRAVFAGSWRLVSFPFDNALDPKAEVMALGTVPRNSALEVSANRGCECGWIFEVSHMKAKRRSPKIVCIGEINA